MSKRNQKKARAASKGVLSSPLLRYFGLFALIMVVFYLIWFTGFFRENILNPWNAFNAWLSAGILRILGQGTTAEGMLIIGAGSSISIKEGCDAIEPAMLFIAAVCAFPAALSRKVRGIAAGLLILFGVNIIRIISLFLIEKYWPAAFEFMHIQFWQVAFIALAVLLWISWMRTTKPQTAAGD